MNDLIDEDRDIMEGRLEREANMNDRDLRWQRSSLERSFKFQLASGPEHEHLQIKYRFVARLLTFLYVIMLSGRQNLV
jgi:hypothetical protein